MDDVEGETKKVSDYNSASLINLTLNNLWNDYYRHFRSGSVGKANADLDCIWTELGGDVEEDDKSDKNFKKIEKELNDLDLSIPIKASGFAKVSKDDSVKKAKQFEILREKALFLKRLQYTQGKGTKYREGDEDYMD